MASICAPRNKYNSYPSNIGIDRYSRISQEIECSRKRLWKRQGPPRWQGYTSRYILPKTFRNLETRDVSNNDTP